MNLTDLRETVSATTREEWNSIGAYGAGTAPIAPSMLQECGEPDRLGAFYRFHVRAHTRLLVLIADVDVSIAWGMSFDPAAEATGHRLHPSWAPDDWELTYEFADVRYRGQLVDRYVMADVKGLGRAVLPVSRMEFMPGGGDLPHLDRVTRVHYELARLLHSANYGDDWAAFDQHFEFTGIGVDG